MLRCPVCKKVDMAVLELHEIEIDYCLDCGGIWLDSGELELLMGSAERKNEILLSFKDAEKTHYNEKTRPCPICDKAMKKVEVVTENGPVVVDECVARHGLWFDKGELYHIVNCAADGSKEKSPVLEFLSDIFCGKNQKEEDNK